MPRVNRHKARFRAYRLGAIATLRKGLPFCHTIASAYVRPNNEYRLHATKGFRYQRLASNRNLLLETLMQRSMFQ